ncbi:similar to Saccharomyces cerevisiae YIL034C CAP2 Beta subunit of the capping protein (CP) heterodimer (Cap1p and Cap2p) which binds to the barbed ends of actin filaments preventing further polymerization [Maudiozyma barnettii]|uniref:F-actin-capping protein subunit beta n=1 Tax=Maudiozyma barnettii TaxID=61262 RepID=A0A8H2ZIP7_9SACH|nr:F-actin-capping protein subunit beta [Kazachstania barnettii]CAB4255737.1 similar to Saccharomyces cerevisiae YIL034C CAP2 Beta subunit of the capping protein (CP) heterodimer (Cap1p and Cap2p) which binds to the barbed ends of actin filaments preventing further polymerization [Kazachstania barnettii]CAD1784298.1 similar to Saccharomyces cerevisiae YIL034C CAP2 Beta subunit of the capping protein (CP) heterodimer (Cap1p and Cap2p) which binds to the barbed ends of actin filaments preventing fu
MSSDEKYDAALDLLRRLDPTKVKTNLQNLISLEPSLAEDLLSSIDLPLTIKQDTKASNREFLCCDYNRDMDSHRSPWSNDYYPQLSAEDLAESPFPSEKLRELEIICNDSFDVYRDLYYEGGVSSVYLWDLDEESDFAGVILFKKSNSSSSSWDSIHVIEVTNSGNADFNYKVTTTIILQLDNHVTSELKLSGNLTRQTERDIRVDTNKDDQLRIAHITNLGTLIEDVESQMRDMLETVYFEKTRDIFHQNKNSLISKNESGKNAQAEIVKGLQNL